MIMTAEPVVPRYDPSANSETMRTAFTRLREQVAWTLLPLEKGIRNRPKP